MAGGRIVAEVDAGRAEEEIMAAAGGVHVLRRDDGRARGARVGGAARRPRAARRGRRPRRRADHPLRAGGRASRSPREDFLTEQNLLNILRQYSVPMILAVGQTLVIVSRGIDLSVAADLGAVGQPDGRRLRALGLAGAGCAGAGRGRRASRSAPSTAS